MNRSAGRRGYNLVEILITLTLLSILTATILTFVTDYQARVNVTRAKNDIMQIAQMAMYSESRSGSLVTTLSVTGTELATALDPYLIRVPDRDPWGNRFQVDINGLVVKTEESGTAYLVDRAMGRVICAGPDGKMDTLIGRGPADFARDIVVDFRHKPWIFYVWNRTMGLIRPDGTDHQILLPTRIVDNVTVAPDASRCAGIIDMGGGNWRVFCSNLDLVNPDLKTSTMAVTEMCYPVWFPNSRHLAIMATRQLYVADTGQPGTIVMFNGGQPIYPKPPLVFVPASWDSIKTNARTLFASDKGSTYMVEYTGAQGVYVAVSRDGKVAFSDTENGGQKGIHVCLMDGSAHRLLVPDDTAPVPPNIFAGEFSPVMWINENELLYFDRRNKDFKRVRDDGTFKFNLHGPWDRAHPSYCSVSPDRQVLMFKANAGTGYAYMLRTDGAGFLTQSKTVNVEEISGSDPAATGQAEFAPLLWPLKTTQRLGRTFHRVNVLLDAGATSKVVAEIEVEGQKYWGISGGVKENVFVPQVKIDACNADVDPSENLIVVLSRVKSVGAAEPAGIYVLSLSGPSQAFTKLLDWGAGNLNTYSYVKWLAS